MVPWQLLFFLSVMYIYIIDNMIDKQLIVMSIICLIILFVCLGIFC
ncbi:MAG: hypothetical protein ACKPKO_54485 [Candidatus Fonsibacter sp.]